MIIEYIVCKVISGYDTKMLTSEFITFLQYFKEHIPVDNALYDGKELFTKFFERKNMTDWSYKEIKGGKIICKLNLDIKYDEAVDDYYIMANY